MIRAENTNLFHKGKYHCTADFLFYWFGLDQIYLLIHHKQSIWIQTSKSRVSHSSVGSWSPSILPPGFKYQANHLCFIVYSQIWALFVFEKNEMKEKEAGFGPLKNK